MKTVITIVLPCIIIAVVEAIAKANGYMLGAIPVLILALGSFALGRKLGEKWEERHGK